MAITLQSQRTALTTSFTDITLAVVAGQVMVVKDLRFANSHASTDSIVTVQFDDNSVCLQVKVLHGTTYVDAGEIVVPPPRKLQAKLDGTGTVGCTVSSFLRDQ